MKLNVVNLSATDKPLRPSPGFAKKRLSDYALDILGLCEYGCRYCSSNAGNFLRIRREEFADATQAQLGERLYPSSDPTLTFHWPNVLDNLRKNLERRPRTWGAGRTVVFSMLTDGFSPGMVASGTTRSALDMLLEKTSLRIRILTKNACVGLSKEWVSYFVEHADRFVVGLSIGTLSDEWSKKVEINTSPPSQRVKALHRLQDASVPTYGMMCPIFPDVLNFEYEESKGYGRHGLQRLVEAIRPAKCETIWAEPFNDRANWIHVQEGYVRGSGGWERMKKIFEDSRSPGWSNYATDLCLILREIAYGEGWIDNLVYLLYESKITDDDARRLCHLERVLLQSKPDDAGRSTNAGIASLRGALKP